MVHHLASLEGCAMEQILHGSAHTIEAVRRAIQHSEKSLRVLAKRYGINQKTVAKWKTRTAVKDRSEEHTSELQSLMRISYAVFCLKKKTTKTIHTKKTYANTQLQKTTNIQGK